MFQDKVLQNRKGNGNPESVNPLLTVICLFVLSKLNNREYIFKVVSEKYTTADKS